MQDTSSSATILVVEDDSLVAEMLCDELDHAGFDVAGPCATIAASLEALARERVAAVVLDVALRDGPSYPFADRLARRGIPFVFYSSYRAHDLPVAYRQYPHVPKMSPMSTLLRTLEDIT